MANRRLEWGKQAFRQFNKAILYIAEDSIQNELHHLRVAYFVGTDIIRILRVRHTSREPQKY